MQPPAVSIGENEYADTLSLEAIDAKDDQFQVLNGFYRDGEQVHNLPVGYVPGSPDSKLTIIRTMPWSEHPQRPFERGRNAAVAELTSAEVFSVAAPGVGAPNQPLSRSQLDDLHRAGASNHFSSFDAIGQATAQALDCAISGLKGQDYLSQRTVILDLYSQGTSIGAGMLGWLERQPDIVLWREMPDWLHKVSVAEFGRAFISGGGQKFDYYAKHNRALQGHRRDGKASGLARAVKNASANFIHYPSGMAGASLIADFKTAHQSGRLNHETLHVVINGSDSLVSPNERNEQLTSQIKRHVGAAAVRMVVEGGTHSMTNQYELNAGTIQRAIDLYNA